MEPSTREVVQRSPWRSVRLLNLPHLQPEAIEAETSLERDFVHCAALFNYTQKLAFQPFKLSLPLGTYTPDFLVMFRDGSRAVVEVKADYFLESSHDLLEQAKAELHKHGLSYIVATDFLLRHDGLAERALYIRRYAKGASNEREWNIATSLLEGKNTGLPVGALVASGASLPTLLHAVCHRRLQLSADLQYEGAATFTLPADDLGGSHAIRFASWLGA